MSFLITTICCKVAIWHFIWLKGCLMLRISELCETSEPGWDNLRFNYSHIQEWILLNVAATLWNRWTGLSNCTMVQFFQLIAVWILSKRSHEMFFHRHYLKNLYPLNCAKEWRKSLIWSYGKACEVLQIPNCRLYCFYARINLSNNRHNFV